MKTFRKTIVGVTQRIDNIASRAEHRDALDQRVIKWLIRAGFLPVPIPNTILNCNHSTKTVGGRLLESWLQLVQPAALLLSGGNDIGEYPERDATEYYLLSWAETKQIPVLGICRGLQIMAAWFGIELVRVDGHVDTRHHLVVPTHKDKWPTSVNSFHNFALKNCPAGFEILARSEDGEIEAIRHTTLPWEGWMWHPEREVRIHPQDIQRLKEIFE
jgi:N5-(cytidine 5'-diphosphoramidyl)-L-glutamine hydrolase